MTPMRLRLILPVALARTALGLAVLGLAASAQAAEPIYPIGSHIGLVPPAGLVADGNFRGFVDREHSASIIVIEMPVGAYAEIDKTMTPAALKAQGVTQDKREALTLKTGKAFLVAGRQLAEGIKFRKYIMVAVAPETTALVIAQVPESAADVYPDAVIRDALTSLVTRASVPIGEQLSLLPFKVDDLAGFRPVRVVGATALLLTDGPKDEFDAVDQPRLIVAAAPGGPDEAAKRDNFARDFFSGLAGLKDVHITNAEMLRLSGQPVHEIQADAKDPKSDRDVKVVQWIRFGTGAFIHVVGIAPVGTWTETFLRFRSVRDAVGPKEQ
jgi:hypothetical protein